MTSTYSLTSSYRFARFIGWSLVVGIAYALSLLVGGITVSLLTLPLPAVGGQPEPVQFIISSLIAGTLVGLTLGPLASRLDLPLFERACLWFLLSFVLNGLMNLGEAVFFTSTPVTQLARGFAVLAFGQAALAVLLTLLFRPQQTGPGAKTRLRETLAQRTGVSWKCRFGLAALSYLPIYFSFGMIAAPFVLPYYNNPDMGLNLVVPGFGVILPLEIARGVLYAFTLFPLITVLRGGVRSRAFWIGLTIAVLGSWGPALQASNWPLVLRMAHGMESTADAFVYGFVLTWLLGTREPADQTTEQLR